MREPRRNAARLIPVMVGSSAPFVQTNDFAVVFDPGMNFSIPQPFQLAPQLGDWPARPRHGVIRRDVKRRAVFAPERKSQKFVHVTMHHFLSEGGFAMSTKKIAVTLSLVGAMSLSALAPANSAPLTAVSAAAKPSDPAVQQVRWGGWRGGGWHGGWGGGWGWGFGALAAGALIGGALAAATTPYYDPYYYGYGYGYPAYSYGYPGYAYSYPTYGYRPFGAYAYYNRPYWRDRYYRY
jgi:hypothetical protein